MSSTDVEDPEDMPGTFQLTCSIETDEAAPPQGFRRLDMAGWQVTGQLRDFGRWTLNTAEKIEDAGCWLSSHSTREFRSRDEAKNLLPACVQRLPRKKDAATTYTNLLA